MFVELPNGFDSDIDGDKVLQLNKNLCGSCNTALAWFEALKHSLEPRGFNVSEINSCLFIHKDMIVLCFIDDLIYVGHNAAKINSMIADLRIEFLLIVEEDITIFLGI